MTDKEKKMVIDKQEIVMIDKEDMVMIAGLLGRKQYMQVIG